MDEPRHPDEAEIGFPASSIAESSEASRPAEIAATRSSLRHLSEFAFVPTPIEKLAFIAGLARPETWSYRHAQNDGPYPILASYLNYTFRRVEQQGRISFVESPARQACFNTGLTTENYEWIFALFEEETRGRPQEWVLGAFCEESHARLRSFGQLPEVATYFDEPGEPLFDTHLDFRPDLEHIMIDNMERFPAGLQASEHVRRVTLQGALQHAVIRVKQNYKTAIPQFYWGWGGEEEGVLQLLVPLCLSDPYRADLALTVQRTGDVYFARTCLTLDMAYKNARLIARPDTEWLEP